MEEVKLPEEMFAHFRLGFSGQCATLCAVMDEHGYRVGLALCSPRDQFSRSRGRMIARGRVDAGEVAFAFSAATRDDIGGQLRRAFAQYLKEAKDLPRWVRGGGAMFLMNLGWRIYTDAMMP